MAITKTVTLRNGLSATDAYIRIDAFYGSKRTVTYSANTYLSREAFTGGPLQDPAPYLEQEMFAFEPDSSPDAPHVWEQCYAHLKAQDRFADAVDD